MTRDASSTSRRDLPSTATRETVIVPDEVWTEVDLGVTAVRDRYDVRNARPAARWTNAM